MSSLRTYPRGLYFDEFEAGQKITSVGRTVTESDVVRFAGLSGDFNQIHTDAEYCKDTPFKERVAHGLLVLSIASGLAVQTGVLEGTIIAFREISELKFIKPVYIGDTIHVELIVTQTKALPRLGGGIIFIELDVLNQENDTVMKGEWKVLVAGKANL
ncbi:MAG: dehydratase [Anaerolineales bacterium]|nr:dehydratase [Anaerolineales bacterium]